MTLLHSVADLESFACLIEDGEVVAFETDTVPALAAKAFDETARMKIARLKGRDASQKMQVLVDSAALARSIYPALKPSVLETFQKLAQAFWPGALTIIAPAAHSSDTIGVRFPNDSGVLKLLKRTGTLWATSANRSGESPAQNLSEVQAIFGDSVHYYDFARDTSTEPAQAPPIVPSAVSSTVVQISEIAEASGVAQISGVAPAAESGTGVSTSAEVDSPNEVEFLRVEVLRQGSVSETQILAAL